MSSKEQVTEALDNIFAYASKQTGAVWLVVRTLILDIKNLIKD